MSLDLWYEQQEAMADDFLDREDAAIEADHEDGGES